MQVTTTFIEGLLIIQPDVFSDARGYFYEPYNKKKFAEAGISEEFVQDNQSFSQKGVIRGLHFQNPPHAQAKLLRVIQGSIWDVAVDIRKTSPTYGKYVGVELSAENKTLFYVPKGFAHGFLTLEDDTVLLYKCSDFYNKPSEESIIWNDSDIMIPWNIDNPVLSEKDSKGKNLKEFNSQF
ncbi:MAG TPA: dTDP-4-dehydrorhamnose 3,5-epimerase [Bacteroidia bacterium]|jgi:dTDP-4-dehydrorhamnose 3,5-epimerase|nr:dTDP-4-dehydrorhamnose 3,5-epimerase [Bacteroidia bacterium]